MMKLLAGVLLAATAFIANTAVAAAITPCVSADCGAYAATVQWGAVAWAHPTTGYNITLNGNSTFDTVTAPATSYTYIGMDCGGTFTVGVQAHDGSGHTSPVLSTSYETPACPGPPPANTTAPYFTGSGEAVVGQTLTVGTGSWSNSPSGYSYQWDDCATTAGQPPTTASCSAITGATSASYAVQSSDSGHSLVPIVTATNGNGAASTSISGGCDIGENNSQGESNTAPAPAETAGCSPISAVVGSTASTEKFCSNSFVTCGYPDPLNGNVGVPAGTTLTPIESASLPSGASWSSGTLELSGNNITLSDLKIDGNVRFDGTGDTIQDSVIETGICPATCSNAEPVEAFSTASNTQLLHDTIYGGDNGTVHNASGNPMLINYVYSYGACTGQLGYGDVWNSYFITDIVITNQGGTGLCHAEPGYVPGGFNTWSANPWGGTCPGSCGASNQSYTNYQHDVMLNPQDQTAAVFLDNHAFGETGNNNVTVASSFVAGGDYAIYGDTAGDTSSNIVISSNRWSQMYYSTGGYFGPCSFNSAATTLSGNLWDNTLTDPTTGC